MTEWILSQDGVLVYTALFMLLMGGAIGLPIPEDITLILAGILVSRGSVDPFLTLAICYLGSVLGDIVIFLAGRRLGKGLYQKAWFKERFNPIRYEQMKASLEKRSFVMIFVARHLFYLRTVTFLSCGAIRMSFERFLIADAISALVSVPIISAIGYLGAENYEAILDTLRKTKTAFLVATVVAIALFFIHWRRRTSAGEN